MKWLLSQSQLILRRRSSIVNSSLELCKLLVGQTISISTPLPTHCTMVIFTLISFWFLNLKIIFKTSAVPLILTRVRGITRSVSARHRRSWVQCSAVIILVPDAQSCTSMLGLGLNGTMLDQNRVIAKDDKRCTYCCYVSCLELMVWVGGINWPKTSETQ